MKIYNFEPQEYNTKLAEALKKVPEINAPEWSFYVKTSPSKERPTDEEDFWHKRTASVMRQLYKRQVVGVNRLRTRYGSKKNRGYKPERFVKAGGKMIRTILQQLDKAGFTEVYKPVKGIKGRSGRKLTVKGKEFMEAIK